MQVFASNGKEYDIVDGVESEVMGGSTGEEMLVIRDANNNNIAFFPVRNIDAFGQPGVIESKEANTN